MKKTAFHAKHRSFCRLKMAPSTISYNNILVVSAIIAAAAPASAYLAAPPASKVARHFASQPRGNLTPPQSLLACRSHIIAPSSHTQLYANTDDSTDEIRPKIGLAPLEQKASTIEEIAAATDAQDDTTAPITDTSTSAATNTVNARLQAELAAAAEAEKAGGKSKLAKKVRAAFKSEKTDEERQRSIEEARNLNGVNPLVAGGSGLLAFGGSYALWTATSFIADLFANNPVETDFYTAARLSGVFRNVVIGLFSLASGFFGVIGLGLVLLGGRVAIGVLTGELDPTPIRKRKDQELEMPNVIDLMLNKKPGRRGGRKKGRSDDNPFGL